MAKSNGQRPANSGERRLIRDEMIQSYLVQTSTLNLTGFKSKQSELHIHSKNAIHVSIGTNDDQSLVYEFAIPFSELYAGNAEVQNNLITMNVAVNALARPSAGGSPGGGSRPVGSMSGGGRGSGLGGGRSGGGMGGGRPGGGMSQGGGPKSQASGDKSGLFVRTSFKQKIKLAAN